MKLITISGSPEATSQFARQLKDNVLVNRRNVLVSNDIHVLIHQRRSANPPQYAVADVSSLTPAQRETIWRHFPGAQYTVIDPSAGDNDIAYLARTSL